MNTIYDTLLILLSLAVRARVHLGFAHQRVAHFFQPELQPLKRGDLAPERGAARPASVARFGLESDSLRVSQSL